MDKPFSAYRGSDPYVFVCYAHDDRLHQNEPKSRRGALHTDRPGSSGRHAKKFYARENRWAGVRIVREGKVEIGDSSRMPFTEATS